MKVVFITKCLTTNSAAKSFEDLDKAGFLGRPSVEKQQMKKVRQIHVWYLNELHCVFVLSFLPIVFDFIHDLRLGLRHQLLQWSVGGHGFHKRVLWTQKEGAAYEFNFSTNWKTFHTKRINSLFACCCFWETQGFYADRQKLSQSIIITVLGGNALTIHFNHFLQ